MIIKGPAQTHFKDNSAWEAMAGTENEGRLCFHSPLLVPNCLLNMSHLLHFSQKEIQSLEPIYIIGSPQTLLKMNQDIKQKTKKPMLHVSLGTNPVMMFTQSDVH